MVAGNITPTKPANHKTSVQKLKSLSLCRFALFGEALAVGTEPVLLTPDAGAAVVVPNVGVVIGPLELGV
jgi:hypothetical protein